jgi:eukaryotic-like serine/threonine-protein kinase
MKIVGETKQVLNGRYQLLERLGGGGMSVVWRAYDEVLDRYVAVKVLAAEHTEGFWPRERIRREAQAAARLSHPHVTAVHDYGESVDGSGERVPFVVMELLAGQTLAQRIAGDPVPPGDALRITAEVATALAAAHAHGLVHCDIKPANIMLTPAGAKVLDFGITAAAGNQGEPGPDGLVVGTPAYLAPERFTRGEVSPSADVYALGLVLYRMLAGAPPWPAESIMDRLEAHASLPPEPLPANVPVPAEVTAICLRCLAKDPEERPTAYGLALVLAEAGGWRLVPAPAGGIVLGGVVAHRGAGRVRRRLRKALTVPLTISRHPAPAVAALLTGHGTGDYRAWRGRATRITAAAVVGVVGMVAGWGLPDGTVDRGRPEASQAAPAVPRAPSGETGLPPTVEQPDQDQDGTTDDDAPPSTGAVGGPVSGGGAGSDLVSEPRGGSPGGGSGSAPGGGQSPGDDTDPPAPEKTTPPPAPKPAEPTPSPRPTTAAPAPVEQVKSIVTAGGTIVVRCVGSTASILSVSPLAGFGILDIDRGPGAEVSVALNALLLTVRVTVRCASGIPKASIEIS